MKKIILIFALVAFAATVTAQETKPVPKKPSNAGFVSNGFWDNWELSIGAGVGTAFTELPDFGKKSERFGWEGNVSLTKWFHPVWGARLQLQGGKFANFNEDLVKEKWPYVFVHSDLMVNLSNWLGGYREDRAYYAVPFFGFGYMATNITKKSQDVSGSSDIFHSFAFSYGLLNKFRISPKFDVNIELKGLITPAQNTPLQNVGQYLFGLSATAGFTYRFNQRDFQRGVPGYTEADIKAFQDAIAAGAAASAKANAENARLSDELAAARAAAEKAAAEAARARAAEAAANKAAAEAAKNKPSSTIFFDYSASQLTAKDKTRLELVADQIKAGAKDKVYAIEGHADQATGTKAGNKRVAEMRAKNVYDYLVKQGVNADQLTYQGKGNDADLYKNQKANRAAIIK